MNTTAQVRQFVASNFYVADTDSLRDEDSLLEAGIVDSTGVLEVIAFVESQFGLTIEDEEIVPENFDSVARITGFIHRKSAVVVQLAAHPGTRLHSVR
jgi:acyl carrier protein